MPGGLQSPTHAAECSLEAGSEGSDTSPHSPHPHQHRAELNVSIHQLPGSSIQQQDALALLPRAGRGAAAAPLLWPRPPETPVRAVDAEWLLLAVASELCAPGSSRTAAGSPGVQLRGAPRGQQGPLVPLPAVGDQDGAAVLLERLEQLLASVEVVIPVATLAVLPRELLLHAMGFLPVADVRRAGKVCSDWRRVSAVPLLWRNLCVAQWPRFSEECERQLQRAGAQLSAIADTGPTSGAEDTRLFWRRAFNRKARREHAWLSRRSVLRQFPCMTVISQTNGIHCVQFDDTDLFTGSGTRNEIGIWDIGRLVATGGDQRRSLKGTLTGHTNAVTCLQFDAQNVLSGSLDSQVRLWRRADLQCERVLTGHTDKVWCVQFVGDRAVSGSSDKSVRLWNLNTGECILALRDHRTSVSCVCMDDRIVVSGSAGNSIRVWDLGDGGRLCTSKLKGHQKGVFCIQFDAAKLISGSLDNTLRVWDRRDGFRLVRTITGDRGPATGGDDSRGIISFAYDDTKIVSGGADNLIKVWDMRRWEQVHSLAGHSHWITSLQFDEHRIVTGSRDKTVKLWDITDPER
eukprot:TRINITY_DN35293_c0_g1_i1.p1 TRINITY_DN35293_c0_g1~~TRINITY_DN35293_c0_g1_i1.p1  ORF type:complete len:574 (+),score=143.34 TRINITY_DN35293_c0_g1_i1:66-1787(+)